MQKIASIPIYVIGWFYKRRNFNINHGACTFCQLITTESNLQDLVANILFYTLELSMTIPT
jgi:hypothetical protein